MKEIPKLIKEAKKKLLFQFKCQIRKKIVKILTMVVFSSIIGIIKYLKAGQEKGNISGVIKRLIGGNRNMEGGEGLNSSTLVVPYSFIS